MLKVLTVVVTVLVAGCMNAGPEPYTHPLSNDWGATFLRGVVGEIPDIDNGTNLARWVDDTSIQFAGNVPHQTRDSTVFVNVRIANTHLFEVGEEITQTGLRDTWSASTADGPVMDVYVCPNGEGVSGFADQITVTRTGPDSYSFRATSSLEEQNLDVDLDRLPL